jgi:hypothetical protein
MSPAIVMTIQKSAEGRTSALFLHALGSYCSGVAVCRRPMASIQKKRRNHYCQFCHNGDGNEWVYSRHCNDNLAQSDARRVQGRPGVRTKTQPTIRTLRCSILSAAYDPPCGRLKIFSPCDLGRFMSTVPHWKCRLRVKLHRGFESHPLRLKPYMPVLSV